MLIHLICAARPNFMKIAPLYHTLRKEDWAHPIIVHTGQHYDPNMSDSFFTDLGLPIPDIHLGIGSGTHAEQTGKVMMAYEMVLQSKRPDLTVVVGDVNSTVAATLAATKMGIKVAHLEAGLRSFDRSMPEEINRIVTDALADYLWTPSTDADENLLKEGVAKAKIHRVGNIMIDSFEMLKPKITSQNTHSSLNLEPFHYGVVTLHRPSNVDDPQVLKKACDNLIKVARTIPLVFPVHPRTRKKLDEIRLLDELSRCPNLLMPDPMNYIRFMSLVWNARFVITDSGGIQEETSYLGIPCLTLRDNTERPITISQGTNVLCKLDEIEKKIFSISKNSFRKSVKIELWDGETANRIKNILFDYDH